MALALSFAVALAVPLDAGAEVTLDTSYLDPAISTGFSFTYPGEQLPPPEPEVRALVAEPGGGILVGGDFTRVSGQPRNGIARLKPDGSLDPSLVDSGAEDQINAIAVEADGKLLVGGEFISIGGAQRARIARLNANGTLDPTFTNPDVTGGGVVVTSVRSIAVQPNGKILIAGNFTQVDGRTRNKVARLNADGTLDTGFDPGTDADSVVNEVVLQADGKILIGGTFSYISGQPREALARLNQDGSLDSSFKPGTSHSEPAGCERGCFALPRANSVFSIALVANGKILIGTWDLGVGKQADFSGVARLEPDGQVDSSFKQEDRWPVGSIAVQSDGKILYGSYAGGGVSRLHADGRRDRSFEFFVPGSFTRISGILPLDNGKTLISGDFAEIGGQGRKGVARLNPATPLPPATIKVARLRARITKNGGYLTSRVTVSDEGKVTQSGSIGNSSVCGVTRTLQDDEVRYLRCTLTAKARRALRRGSLKVIVKTTFAPTDGDPVSTTRNLKIGRSR